MFYYFRPCRGNLMIWQGCRGNLMIWRGCRGNLMIWRGTPVATEVRRGECSWEDLCNSPRQLNRGKTCVNSICRGNSIEERLAVILLAAAMGMNHLEISLAVQAGRYLYLPFNLLRLLNDFLAKTIAGNLYIGVYGYIHEFVLLYTMHV